MIIVRRSTTNVNKLQRNLISINSNSPSSAVMMSSTPLPVSSSNTCSSSGSKRTGGGGQNQPFDWNYILSPENKARTIQLLSSDRDNSPYKIPKDDKAYRKAAVLIPICFDVNGVPSLLYNLRSSNLSKHSGEISFPGGAIDPEDKDDPIVASLRETNEELGISRNDIEIWTTLRIFPTIAANMGVIPVLGFLKNGLLDPASLKINPDEVAYAFTVSLEHLSDPKNWQDGVSKKFKGIQFNMPIWKNLNVYNGSEEVKLWGLTAFITHLTLQALLPREVYGRKLANLYLELFKNSETDDNPNQSNPSKL